MHDFFLNIKQNPLRSLKIAGGVFLGLIVLSVGFQFVESTFQPLHYGRGIGLAPSNALRHGKMMHGDGYAMEEAEMAFADTGGFGGDSGGADGSGNDAEDFEVTEYNGTIKTHDKDAVCSDLAALKSHEYVIFENANQHTTGCNFSFKVEHERAEEILNIIEAFDPEHLSAHTYTIKGSVEHLTSEVEILQEKLDSINETLDSAIAAYDDITKLATAKSDAESLATVIDSKVRLIERLTQERIRIHERLSRLERNQKDQLDRLDYTYFSVSVYEDKYFDGTHMKNSWKNAIQSFIRDTNTIAQDATIGVVTFILFIVQYVLYGLILLLTVKYSWKYAKRIWNR